MEFSKPWILKSTSIIRLTHIKNVLNLIPILLFQGFLKKIQPRFLILSFLLIIIISIFSTAHDNMKENNLLSIYLSILNISDLNIMIIPIRCFTCGKVRTSAGEEGGWGQCPIFLAVKMTEFKWFLDRSFHCICKAFRGLKMWFQMVLYLQNDRDINRFL